MTEQPKKPSWETLAQELGADSTSPPVRPRVEPPKPVAPPAAVGTPAPLPTTPEAPKKRGWDDLASWLGLGGGAKRNRPESAPPAPPIAPLVAPPPPVVPEAKAAEPPRYEPRGEPRRDRRDDRRDRQRPERHEPRREETPAPAARSSADDVDDELSIDRPEGRHAAPPSESGEGDQPRRRRRRRRRGGRGRNRDAASGEAPRRESYESADDHGDAEFVRDADDREFDDHGRDEVDASSSDSDDRVPAPERNGAERGEGGESRRPRRRRRRGRGGRDRDRGPAESRPPRMESESPLEDDDVLDVDEESITRERIRAEGIADELDDVHDDEGGEEAHLMHRGIPTWEEAIGMIVNVNMEARAKHPHSSSGQHHRGGRGRGRGGRDRR